MTLPYKCFVITPFGDRHSTDAEQRRVAEYVELVYERIFRRVEVACADKGVEIKIEDGRANRNDDDLLVKILCELERSDVIIALLFNANRNVYLELGWAFGMWRSPILLVRKVGLRRDIASDLDKMVCVEYNDEQINDETGQNANQVVAELVDRVIDRLTGPKYKNPRAELEHVVATGLITIYSRFSKGISTELWSEIIEAAEEKIILYTPRGYDIRKRKFRIKMTNNTAIDITMPDLLLKKARDGIKVTVLLSDPDSYTEGHLLDSSADDLKSVRESIRKSYAAWSSIQLAYLRDPNPNLREDGFRVIPVRNRYVPYRITFTEKRAIVTLRFFTEEYDSLFCVDATPRTALKEWDKPFFEQIEKELSLLIRENEAAAEDEFKKQHPDYKRRSA